MDTGLHTQTGGRIGRIREYIGNETFMINYGDAVGDVNIRELLAFHRSHGKIGTLSVYISARTRVCWTSRTTGK